MTLLTILGGAGTQAADVEGDASVSDSTPYAAAILDATIYAASLVDVTLYRAAISDMEST